MPKKQAPSPASTAPSSISRLANPASTYQYGTGQPPQGPRQVPPGSRATTSWPDRQASGGQVIGSTARARRPRGGPSGSPVNTCHQPNAPSAQTDTRRDPSGADSVTAGPSPDPPSPNVVSRLAAPIRRPPRKSHSVPVTIGAASGSLRPSTTSRRSAGIVSTTSSRPTPGGRT